MLLYYLLHAPCLYLWYSTIFYCPTAYTFGTLLSSTGFLPITTVLFHLLLALCLSLCYSTIFSSIPAYTYGTLLPSTCSLTIPKVIYYLLLTHCLSLWYSINFYWPTAYSSLVYWLHAYPYEILLSSTDSLPIRMVLVYLLLAPCLSL